MISHNGLNENNNRFHCIAMQFWACVIYLCLFASVLLGGLSPLFAYAESEPPFDFGAGPILEFNAQLRISDIADDGSYTVSWDSEYSAHRYMLVELALTEVDEQLTVDFNILQRGGSSYFASDRPPGEYLYFLYAQAGTIVLMPTPFLIHLPGEISPPEDIAEIFPSREPILLYDFDEGTGSTVFDKSSISPAVNLLIEDTTATSWLDCGGLSLDSATRLTSQTPPAKFINAAKLSGEFSIEAWIKTSDFYADAPGWIVNIAASVSQRAMLLFQSQTNLYGLTNTSNNPDGGLAYLSARNVPELTHVVYIHTANGAEGLYINGFGTRDSFGYYFNSGDLNNWLETFSLILGNALGAEQPWLGEFYKLGFYDRAFYGREIEQRYQRSAHFAKDYGLLQSPQTTLKTTCNKPPVASFDIESTSGFAPFNAVFDASNSYDVSDPIVNIHWDFGDGNTATGTNATHTYSVPGEYEVTLTVTDASGAISQTTHTVRVLPAMGPGRSSANLVALYTFSEGSGDTVNDESGYSSEAGEQLDLVISNTDNTHWLSCGGLSIDSATSLLSIDSQISNIHEGVVSTNEITIEAWVNPDSANLNHSVATLAAIGGDGTLDNAHLQLDQFINYHHVSLRTNWVDEGEHVLLYTDLEPIEDLIHLTLTRNAIGAIHIYVDGQLTDNFFSDHIGGNLVIGEAGFVPIALANSLAGDLPWLGSLHLFAIYNRALSAGEVIHHYELGIPNSCGANLPPDFTSTPVTSASINTAYQYQVATTDPEGQAVSYQLDNAPDGMAIDINSGLITWLPDTAGDFSVIIRATDSFAPPANATQSFTLTVDAPDTDGDGVPDYLDVFPGDNTRSRHPTVGALALAATAATGVQLDWNVPSTIQNLAFYRVYRSSYNTDDFQILSDNVTDTEYLDATAINGDAYDYRVVAVADIGVEGDPAVAAIFYAYNITSVANLIVVNDLLDARLDWLGSAGFSYRIYRENPNGSITAITDVAVNTYNDTTVQEGQSYIYYIKSLANFNNPINTQAVILEGPPSNAVIFNSEPSLTLTLNNGVLGTDDIYQQYVVSSGEVSISGTYDNALSDVTISVTVEGSSNPIIATTVATNGTFQLAVLFSGSSQVLDITLAEQVTEPTPRMKVVKLRLVIDGENPVVTLDNSENVSASSETFILEGTAVDNSGVISQIYATSSQFSDTTFEVFTLPDNKFAVELPLQFGENTLTVFAEDNANNVGQASIVVNREVGLAPTIVIDSPVSGQSFINSPISVSGKLYTSLPAENVRIIMGEREIYPEPSTNGVFDYRFNDVHLVPGANNIVVRTETTVGNATVFVTVLLQQDDDTEPDPPVINILHPNLSRYTAEDEIIVSGDVHVAKAPVTLTVNGVGVSLVGPSDTGGTFQHLVALAAINAEQPIVVVATDGDGRSSTKTIAMIRDNTAPMIVLDDSGLVLSSDVNTVYDNPYLLTGTVSDENLASLTLNNNVVELLPINAFTYTFSVALDLPLSVGVSNEVGVTIQAIDFAGNIDVLDLTFDSEAQTKIEFISPYDGEVVQLNSVGDTIDIIARLESPDALLQAQVTLDGGVAQVMAMQGDVITATVAVGLLQSEHQLTIELLDAGNARVAASSIGFETIDLDNISLVINRIEPANNTRGIEPNASVNVYFNKPIDPTKLAISLRETVSGMSYDTNRPPVTDIPSIENAAPVQIIRNQEPVVGTVGILPGEQVATFVASSDITYGADVYVDVVYDGETLGRYTYKVRSIPSFVQGLVADQLAQPLADLKVSLPDLGLSTVTDENGSFSFGFGLNAEQALPAGRHTIVYNPERQNSRYGEMTYWVDVQQGHLNRVGVFKVPLLSDEVPSQYIRSGQSSVILANSELELDLSNATLRFPDGKAEGNVHTQFTPVEHLSFPSLVSAMPQWLFQLQPSGIRVRGQVEITIDMPRLYGSYNYVPQGNPETGAKTKVLIIGLDPVSRQHLPIGVGEVQSDSRKVTATVEAMQLMDYIGYAIIDYAAQPLLTAYADGDINLQQLIQQLESAY